MGKPAGSPKSGGRKKGSPNKRTVAFIDALDARGIDLLGEVLDLAQTLDTDDKIAIYLALLPYQFPKRKPTERTFSLKDHLDQCSRDQLRDLHCELGDKLGYRKKPKDFTPEEREEYMNRLREILRSMEAQDELGIGED